MPVQAGIQAAPLDGAAWIPASAGMTKAARKKRPEGRFLREAIRAYAATDFAVSTYSSIWSKFM